MIARISAFLLTAAFAAPALAGTPACATVEQASNIKTYYEKTRPGVPLTVASRFFNVPEFAIASGLPAALSIGTAVTPEQVKTIWSSIDAWGATTRVSLVVTPGSKHAFAFPSLVPITQKDAKDGYIDVYADEGRGVHSHIQLDQVAAVYATELADPKPGFKTRAISFFGPDGHLVIGVYASIKSDPFDDKAVAGFERTRALIASMPRICG